MFNLQLALQEYQPLLKIQRKAGKSYIFDPARKKFVRLTPEEHVRQLVLQYIIHDLKWSKQLIAVEKTIKVGQKIKRFDVLLYHDIETPAILIECKSPKEIIKQKHFDQTLQYNLNLKVKYIWITNGHENYLALVNFSKKKLKFISNINELFPN